MPKSINAKPHRWIPIVAAKIVKFWGLVLNMGLLKKPSIKAYQSMEIKLMFAYPRTGCIFKLYLDSYIIPIMHSAHPRMNPIITFYIKLGPL